MDRNIIQKILIGLFLLTCIFIGLRAFNVIDFNDNVSKSIPNANVSSSEMTYGRFLEYLKMGWVNKVDFYNEGHYIIMEASSPELGNRPQSIQVEIPVGASQVIQMLKEYNINFDAHPAPRKNIFISIASNLLLPSIFIAGLILYCFNFSDESKSIFIRLISIIWSLIISSPVVSMSKITIGLLIII